MPLQNRVTPFGEVVALPGRGAIMGNRGVLHDEHRTLKRQWQLRRWIACRLEWRGIRRAVMTPKRYTELFFLDEAAAFAAGHRPCAECRNADYKRFVALWERCFAARVGADAMDAVLHAERLDHRAKRTVRASVENLPNGTYVVAGDAIAHVVWDDALVAWGAGSYGRRLRRPKAGEIEVLTPPSIVAILRAGFLPGVHPTLAF